MRWLLLVVAIAACGSKDSPTKEGSRTGVASGSGSAELAGSIAASANAACDTTPACEAACTAGRAAACTAAAEHYFEGANGRTLDHAKSFALAKRACDLQQGHGCAILGFHYQDGLGGAAWSPDDAIAAYRKGCDLGVGVACFNLATIYEGHGIAADLKRADDFYLRAREAWTAACEGDQPRWCTNVAYMIAKDANQKPTEKELERMLALNTRACEHGTLVGCVQKLRVTEDLKRIEQAALAEELAKLCTAGEPTACTFVGGRFLVGADTATGADRETLARRGISLMKRGCEIGDKYACSQMALHSITARYTEKDFAAAEQYFEQACNRALGSACTMIAKRRQSAESSWASAVDYARRACQIGDGEGCLIVAQMTMAGQGIAKDEAGALRWFHHACSNAELDACEVLARRDLPLPVVDKHATFVHEELCKRGVTASCGKPAP